MRFPFINTTLKIKLKSCPSNMCPLSFADMQIAMQQVKTNNAFICIFNHDNHNSTRPISDPFNRSFPIPKAAGS